MLMPLREERKDTIHISVKEDEENSERGDRNIRESIDAIRESERRDLQQSGRKKG